MAVATMTADASAVLADLALLEDAAGRSLDVRNRLVDLLHQSPDMVCVDRDSDLARAAGDCVIRFQLAKPFLELVTALRAGQIGGLVFEDRFHG